MPGTALPSRPLRHFLTVLAIVFLAEGAVMILLPLLLPGVDPFAAAITDAILLTILSAPFLWWAIVRPLRRSAMVEHTRAATIISNAVDGIITLNAQGLVESFNPAAEQLFGYRAEEVVGRPLTPLMPERYRNAHQAGLERARVMGTSGIAGKTLELHGLRKDGSEFPMELSVASWKTEKGTYYAGFVHDITEREQAEAQFHLQRAGLESAANAVVITDRHGCISWVNPAFTRLTGYTKDEVLGQNPRLLKSSQYDQSFYQNLWETILSGQVWHGEIINRRKDGSLYTEEQTITPVRGLGGEIDHFIAIKLDVTERKRTEMALRESEERYRDLVEQSEDLICTHDLEGRILSANPAMTRCFGFERPEELLGHKIGDYLAPDVRHLFKPYLDTVVKDGYAKGVMKVVTASGEERILEYLNSLRTEGVDRPIVRGRSHDVTERVRAERSLATGSKQMESLRAVSMEMARELNLEVLLELIVRKAAELLQVRSGAIFLWDETTETLSTAAWVGHGEWMKGVRLKRGEGVPGIVVQRGEGMIVNDYRTSPYAGPIFLERTTGTAVVSEPILYHNQLIGVLVMNNEGTDRRFTEQDLELLGLLAGQAASAIENTRLHFDLGESKGKIEELYTLGVTMQEQMSLENRLDLILTGAKAVLGFDRINILLPDHEMKMLKAVASVGVEEPLECIRVPLGPEGGGIAKAFLDRTEIVWEGSGSVPEEWRLGYPYSEIQAFRSKAFVIVPLIVGGQPIGVLGADNKATRKPISAERVRLLKTFATQAALTIDNARLYDEVTEYAKDLEQKVEERTKALKETQVQLVQSGKLAAVGTLAAGVAHELNQPLMVIRGYAQELVADERITDKEIREDLGRIEAQTTRMSAIITHLRDFSRQSKGARQVTDLNQVVTHAFTFLGQQLKARNIDVVQELDAALPKVWADPLQIEQVLLNLVTNARDAMEKAGRGMITIRTEAIQNAWVALSVTDTGPGISRDLQGRIFDPFFTTKEVGKGTGLGLSICHGIAEEHGGELRVESPAAGGRGARFTVVLPVSLRDPGKGDRV